VARGEAFMTVKCVVMVIMCELTRSSTKANGYNEIGDVRDKQGFIEHEMVSDLKSLISAKIN
jgi:hypothetical protein